MSYHPASYLTTRPGQAVIWAVNPEPHLAANPQAAGPRRVGVGRYFGDDYDTAAVNGLGCAGGCGGRLGAAGDDYAETSWGMVAMVAAGALLTGLIVGWAAKGASAAPKRRYRSNRRRRRHRSNAKWSTAYKNSLPDSAFLYVDKSRVKYRDRQGRSHPLSARKLPVRNRAGQVDVPHAKNAIARAPQVKGVSATKKRELQRKARRVYYGATGKVSEMPRRELARAA